MPLAMPNLNLNIYALLGVPSSNLNTSPSNSTEKTNKNSSENTFDPSHKFVSSPHIAPLALAALRLLVATYTLVTLIVVLVWKAEVVGGASSFLSYFTYLTYIGLCAYYFASGTQTLAYALSLRRSGASSMRRTGTGALYPLQRWPRVLQAMHVLLQATVVTFPFIVTVVFWALLADSTTLSGAFSAWSNLSVHAFNTVFALFEVLCTNAPPAPWLALLFCELCLVGYLGVAYITHATQGIYTYSFLDPAKQGPLLAAYIIGIALAECIVFALVRGLVILRERWAVSTGRLVLSPLSVSTLSRGVGVTIPARVRDSRETEMENATALGKKEAGAIEIEEEEWEEVETPVSADLGGRVRKMQEV